MDAEPKDPHITMAKCITTSGGDNAHYSGKRAMTPLELSQLQGLPLNFRLHGSRTEAKKQIGNCWSPEPGKHPFLIWAATLEAFDHGLVGPEDDIADLYGFLKQKGVDIGKPAPIDVDDAFGYSSPQNPAEPKYRYISRLEKTTKPKVPLVLWARKREIQPRATRNKQAAASPRTRQDSVAENRRLETLSIRPRGRATTELPEVDDDEEIVCLGSRRTT